MQVRELITRLGFEADNAQAKRYELSVKAVRAAALKAAAAITALSVGTLALARSLSNQGNEIAKSATEAGLAADEFQRLSFAIGQVTRVSPQQAQMALMRLNDTIGRARIEGGRYVESLQRLGFTQEEITSGNINNADAFQRVIEELGKTESSADAAALASRVLGERVGRQLGPALREFGDDAQAAIQELDALGGGFSGKALKSSEALTDSFARVGVITASLRSEIAEALLPVVNELVTSFTDWFKSNRDIILQNFRRTVDSLVFALRLLFSILGDVSSAVSRAADLIGGWERAISLLVSAFVTLAGLKLVKLIGSIASVLFRARTGAVLLTGAMAALAKTPLIAAFVALVFIAEDLLFWLNGQDSAIGRLIGSYDEFKKKVSEVADKFGPEIEVMKRQMRGLGNVIAGALTFDGERLLQGLSDLMEPIYEAGAELGRMLRDGLIDGVGGFFADLLLGKKTGGGMRQPGEQPFSGLQPISEDQMRLFEQFANQARPNTLVNLPGSVPIGSTNRNVNVRADVSLQVPQGTSEQQQAALEQQTRELFDQEMDRVIYNSLWDFQVQE